MITDRKDLMLDIMKTKIMMNSENKAKTVLTGKIS